LETAVEANRAKKPRSQKQGRRKRKAELLKLFVSRGKTVGRKTYLRGMKVFSFRGAGKRRGNESYGSAE